MRQFLSQNLLENLSIFKVNWKKSLRDYFFAQRDLRIATAAGNANIRGGLFLLIAFSLSSETNDFFCIRNQGKILLAFCVFSLLFWRFPPSFSIHFFCIPFYEVPICIFFVPSSFLSPNDLCVDSSGDCFCVFLILYCLLSHCILLVDPYTVITNSCCAGGGGEWCLHSRVVCSLHARATGWKARLQLCVRICTLQTVSWHMLNDALPQNKLRRWFHDLDLGSWQTFWPSPQKCWCFFMLTARKAASWPPPNRTRLSTQQFLWPPKAETPGVVRK